MPSFFRRKKGKEKAVADGGEEDDGALPPSAFDGGSGGGGTATDAGTRFDGGGESAEREGDEPEMDLSKGWMSILLYHGEGLVSVDSNGMSHTLPTRLYSTWNTHLLSSERPKACNTMQWS
jgi:hypothetical protein